MTDQISGPNDQPNRVSTEGERKAYVRDWIARRFGTGRIAGTGLASTLLTLPVIASAQAADGFVAASQIDGVTNVQTMSDGSVRLVMSNGTTISVPASDVQIGANGNVLVSARVEEIAAEVMAAGGAGAGGGGAILAGAGVAGAAAAVGAGGGGGDGGGGSLPVINSEVFGESGGITSGNTGITLPEGTTSVEVTLVDEDGTETTREAVVGEDGTWTLPFGPEETPPQGRVTVTVNPRDEDGEELKSISQDVEIDTIAPSITIDDTGAGPDGTLNIAEQDAGITVTGSTDAEDGQVVTVTVGAGGPEFTGTVSGGAWSVDIPASGLAGLDPAAADVSITAAVADAAGNPVLTFETIDLDLVAPTISLGDISGDNELGLLDTERDLEITGTTDAEIGQPVTVTFDGADYTGSVISNSLGGAEPNAWSVIVPQSAVQAVQAGADGGLASVDVSATVTDAAGNPAATPATATLAADFTGPSISIDPIAGDNVINAEERDDAGGIIISGSTNNVPVGQDVTVQLDGSALFTVPTDADGNWQVTVPQGDAALPADGESLTVTADVSDGETAAPQATAPLAADFTAPSITIDDTGAGPDGTLNIAEQDAGITVTGSTDAEDGQVVTVTVGAGGPEFTGTVSGGAWSVDIPASGLAGLDPAAADVSITAAVADAAGNPAQDDDTIALDLSAPTISITDTGVGPDGTLNIAERVAGITVEGTATGADGETVTVTLSGAAASTPITATGTVSGGTFAVPFTAGDLAGIGGWSTATVTAEVSDSAGNPAAPATDSFGVDVTAPALSITDTGLASEGVLDIAERDAGITVEGNATGADGQTVTVTLSETGSTTPIATVTGTVSGGSFAVPFTPADLASLGDTTDYTVDISLADAAGNPASESFGLATDFKPIVAFDPIGEDGAIDLSDTAGATLTGTTIGVEAGQDVTVTATAPDSSTILNETATVAADGTWSLPVPAAAIGALAAGDAFTVEATVSNAAGRAADPATETVDAYLASVYAFVNSEEAGSALTITAIGLEGLNVSSGFSTQTDLSFDPAQATFVLGSTNPLVSAFPAVNESDAASGNVTFGLISTASPTLPAALYEFEMTDAGAGPITLAFADADQGGPTELQIGTEGADSLTAGNTDSVIQGKGGDDNIDVSATGTNIVVFELGAGANGTDTVTGFTTGTTFQADQIAAIGADDLRGNGQGIDTLGTGGALSADAGFVIFTTALADTGAATIEAALEGLTGENAGDVFYGLAGDGTDAALVRATVNGTDDISLERLADFTGIGDIGLLSEDNVILADPLTQVT